MTQQYFPPINGRYPLTSNFPFEPAAWSYGLAGLVFVAFAARMLMGWRGGPRAIALFFAVAASAAWAGVVWSELTSGATGGWKLANFMDAVRIGAWLTFMTLLLDGGQKDAVRRPSLALVVRYFAVPAILIFIGSVIAVQPPWHYSLTANENLVTFYAWLGASVFGLALTEQLYRRTPANRRWAIKPLVIGLAGMFALDLLIYSGAVLLHRVDPAMWSARGIACAIVIFFVGVATRRNTSWTIDVYVSRGVVYQSTALLLAGAYLLIVAGAAYWVHFFGGVWGGTLQVAIVFASLLGLAVLMLSRNVRAGVKVLLSKNLFSYRYEYRQEWLRFTRELGASEHAENLYQRAVRALADLVESTGGAIWLEQGGMLTEVARVNMPSIANREPASGSLASFLARTDWVIQIDELAKHPGKYPELLLPSWLASLDNAWLIVPLPNGPDLIGFVILARPRAMIDVNWEVRDLLKTASRQAASFIAQVRAKEALVESRQFDAFNRMSAFVVHDLKNLVAQLALVVKNAERHRDNPEFQQDMLETVEHAVSRMNQLMLQLRTGTSPMEKPRPVDLGGSIQRIIQAKALQPELIDLEMTSDLRVFAHQDRIERVIGHIVQNALEAIDGRNGCVRIRVYAEGPFAIVAVADDGIGMADEFMREKLFHPFQTTKEKGMGIGMHESFQYINGIGGRITVESEHGIGTRFDVYLPLANVPGMPYPNHRSAA